MARAKKSDAVKTKTNLFDVKVLNKSFLDLTKNLDKRLKVVERILLKATSKVSKPSKKKA